MSIHKQLFPVLLGVCLLGMSRGQDEGQGRPERIRGPRMARAHAAEAGHPGGLARQQMILNRIIRDPELFRQAGIEDEQAEALRDLMRQQDERTVALRDELQQASRNQTDLLADPEVSEADLMASVDELGRIQTEMARSRMEGLLGVRKILTPEQIEAAIDLVQERVRERRGDERPGATQREGQRDRPEGARQGQRPEGARQGQRPEGARTPRRQP